MIKKASEDQAAKAPFPPLPVLPVLRAENCGQQETNRAIEWLEKNRRQLFPELNAEEGVQRTHIFQELVWEMLDDLQAAGLDVPQSHLARLDIALELSRRLRTVYGQPQMPALGQPLAARAGDPLPPLPDLEIDEGTRKRGRFEQAQVNRLLQAHYARHPALWYAMAEEYRNDLMMGATDEFMAQMNKLVGAEFPEAERPWKAGELRLEAVRRIYKMCGIEE